MTDSLPDPSLFALARRWAADSLRSRGLAASASYLAGQLWFLLRDNTPERRRSRFGDMEYDFDHAVDTTWARLPLRVRLREVFTERLYQPTVPEEFEAVMAELAAVDFTGYTFIDLGSGKGRALLLATRLPFAAIVGVEVQPELHRTALANLAAFDKSEALCRNLSAHCCDARDYDFPSSPLLVYLFNPFPGYVLERVLANLEGSLRKNPRPVFLAYNAPYEQNVVDAYLRRHGNFLRCIIARRKFVIYSNVEGGDDEPQEES